MANVDKIRKDSEEERVAGVVKQVQRELREQTAPTVSIPEVMTWLETFQKTTFRYKFLVLDGPSRTGKTVFSRSLSPDPKHFLEVEVGCAGVLDPDLKTFKNLFHDFILLDEASTQMVLN